MLCAVAQSIDKGKEKNEGKAFTSRLDALARTEMR